MFIPVHGGGALANMNFLYSSVHFMEFITKNICSKLAVEVAKQGFSNQCLTLDVFPSKNISKLTLFLPYEEWGAFSEMATNFFTHDG